MNNIANFCANCGHSSVPIDDKCRCCGCDIYEQTLKKDLINKPDHYALYEIEPAEFIFKNDLNFWQGNIIKYVCRAPFKDNEITDLKKARRYIDMRLNQLDGRKVTE